MVRRGDIVENPITGERITFLETSEDTNGELSRFEYVLPPRFSIPEHVHPGQEERHEILSGTLRGRMGGRERDFREGELAIGPPNVPHAWRNSSEDEALRIVSELRSALHLEALLEVGFALARDLKTDKKNVPKHLPRYGDVARYRMAHLTWYQVNHPDGVQRVLQENNRNYG